MSDWDNFIDSLSGTEIKTKTSKTEQEFPCGQCAGTGLWQGGRTNYRGNNKCLACKGKGYFKTDPRKLKQARDNRKARFEKAAAAAREENLKHEDGAILRWAEANMHWNDFARSLIDQHCKGDMWTGNQVAALRRMRDKTEATRAAKAAARKAAQSEVDLGPVRGMFETAVSNGYKRPVYRAEGLVINRAPDTGRNPGALYVKDEEGEYVGKIIETTFMPIRGREAVAEMLKAIAADPRGAAIRYGQRTGTCSCCGRTLTNHASIEAGIGPICASKWGL